MRVSANVCRSVMHVDSVDRELSFETCIVNRKYTHDVTVRNHSEIPLTFNLNAVTVGALQEIEVLEVESGDPFTKYNLAAFSNTVIRVVYSPTTVGELKVKFRLSNLYDPSNSIDIRISASVTAEVQDEVVRVNPLAIDFGECYMGQPYRQPVTLWNVSQEPVELDLYGSSSSHVLLLRTMSLDANCPFDSLKTVSRMHYRHTCHGSHTHTVRTRDISFHIRHHMSLNSYYCIAIFWSTKGTRTSRLRSPSISCLTCNQNLLHLLRSPHPMLVLGN